MDFSKFLKYIYTRHSSDVKLGLGRIKKIVDLMGEPNKKIGGFHVGGTNGKGSTSAILESICFCSGFTTGLNTSPHLKQYTERFRINTKEIDQRQIKRSYKKWEKIFIQNQASFFEMTTAMAFDIFFQSKVDLTIFEVGLGGRLDATNVFYPNVSLITSVSLDHTKTLGATTREIAQEKAGILKKGVPIVIGKMDLESLEVIKNRAISLKIKPIIYQKDFFVSNIRLTPNYTSFDYKFKNFELKNLKTNLLGTHQVLNCSYAITAFIEYMRLFNKKIKLELIKKALFNVNWMGRMQIISQNPLVMVDGAHNIEGITTLVTSLKRIFYKKKPIFVVSILRDKNIKLILEKIVSIASKVYVAKNMSSRAAETFQQTKILDELGIEYFSTQSVKEAKNLAVARAKTDDIIVICGSLYTVCEVL